MVAYSSPDSNVSLPTSSLEDSPTYIDTTNPNIYPLNRNVISNKSSNEIYTKDFKNFAESSIPINQQKVLDIYNEVYYDIPVNGNNSHENIVDQSYTYLNSENIRSLQNAINLTIDQIGEKNDELEVKSNPTVLEHPIYEDKSILIAGENGVKYQDMHTVYIMQEGKKRPFDNPEIYNIVKKFLNIPDRQEPLYVTIPELNSIPDGKRINNTSDLLLTGPSLEAEDVDINLVSAYLNLTLYCFGNEIPDIFDYFGDVFDESGPQPQFLLDNNPCKVKYIKDDFTTDDTGPIVVEEIIPQGGSATITILRETDDAQSNIPNNIQSYYDQYGFPDISYNGNTIDNYIREWGQGGRYPSIVYAEGGIRSKEEELPRENLYTGYVPENFDEILFNGLPNTDYSIIGKGTADRSGNYTLADILGIPGYGRVLSSYGTKRIYQESGKGYWGPLGQEDNLQKEVFDNLNNIYYKPSKDFGNGTAYKIYGQPILRWYNKYLVVLDCIAYRSGGGVIARDYVFLDLLGKDGSGELYYGRRKAVRDDLGLDMSYKANTKTIYHAGWQSLDKSRLRFPGLQGYKTNRYNQSGNYANPNNGGSNFEITSANGMG